MARNLFYIIFVSSIGLFSCRTPRYVNAPAAVNAPDLQKAGDNKLGAYYSSNFGNARLDDGFNINKSKGYDLQAAYAISNHWALQASYFHRNEKSESSTNRGSFNYASLLYNRKSADAGIGYYTKMGNSSHNFFQIFAGGGTGKYEIKDISSIDSINYNLFHTADLNKFYLQPAFIFSYDNISFGLVSRFSFVNYKKVETNYSESQQLNFNLDGLQNKTLSFWEPAFVINGYINSMPALRFEFQMGSNFSIDNTYYDVKTSNVSLGLVMDFSKLKKK